MARDIHEPGRPFTDISSVRSRQILQKRSSDQRGRGLQVAEETSIVALVPSAEAKAVTVAVVPQRTSATPGAVLLTASARASTVELPVFRSVRMVDTINICFFISFANIVFIHTLLSHFFSACVVNVWRFSKTSFWPCHVLVLLCLGHTYFHAIASCLFAKADVVKSSKF